MNLTIGLVQIKLVFWKVSFHLSFIDLNISCDSLYSSTQFVILDTKHKNFCIGKFLVKAKVEDKSSWFLRWIWFFSSLSWSRILDGRGHSSHHQGQGHVHRWRLRRDLGKISPSPILRSKSALLTGITIESWQKWKGVDLNNDQSDDYCWHQNNLLQYVKVHS